MSAAHKDDQVLDLGSEKYSGYHSAILLASVALTAFAGAAAAEVSFSGSATLGYNNDTNVGAGAADNYDGYYWESTLSVGLEQALDNGLTAGVKVNVDLADSGDTASNANAADLTSDDFVVYVKSDVASLTYGDTGTAAGAHWKSAGDMEADGFTSDWTDFTNGQAVLRGDVTFGAVSASVSGVVVANQLEATSIGATVDAGAASIALAYEEATTIAATAGGDANTAETLGVSASFAAAGADIIVAYSDNSTNTSTGVKVTYPMGDVTVAAYYVDESNGDANLGLNVAYAAGPVSVAADVQDDQGTTKTAIDASYDMGNGLTLMAGYYDVEGWADAETYLAASYDLGGGASLLVSHVGTDAENDDEVGAGDYQLGTTIELSFAF